MPSLGDVIKEYRRKNNMSMREFSEKSGLTKGYISMLERNYNYRSGSAPVPSIKTYNAVAVAMEMTLDELIRLVDGESVVSLVETTDDEQLYKHYQAIAYILGLDVNDVAMAISFISEVKKK